MSAPFIGWSFVRTPACAVVIKRSPEQQQQEEKYE